MPRLLILLCAVAAVSACSIAPSRPEPGWTDALLAEAPPGQAPNSVSEQSLDRELRRELLTSAVMLQFTGASVREIGASLRAPDIDTAQFVVEARERGRPPPPE